MQDFLKDIVRIVNWDRLGEDFYSSKIVSGVEDFSKEVLEKVGKEGDDAVRAFSKKFDKVTPSFFEISKTEISGAVEKLKITEPEVYEALSNSWRLALDFAKKQRECFTDFEYEISPGLFAGQKNIPVDRAGIYVPAGRFPLLSSVIMGAAPARAAGVREIILLSPPKAHPAPECMDDPDSPWIDEGILAAAGICGIDRVFAIGGAQAIAAMAWGTQSVPKVDVIVGPGNKYVASAKKLAYGLVGIDMIAGPSEVFIIGDSSVNPDWVACDMIAQAEHDPDAQSIFVTVDKKLGENVLSSLKKLIPEIYSPKGLTGENEISSYFENLPAVKSLKNNGFIIIADSLEKIAEIANRKAPEHLELSMKPGPEMDFLRNELKNYGSLFIGDKTAEVLGDYAAGVNHVLPTGGAARYAGGLSVRTFLKTLTNLRAGTEKEPGKRADFSGLENSLSWADTLGQAEGLLGHAMAARIRENKD